MKMANTQEEQRRWVEQWREAGIALDEVRRDELANLAEEEAWRKTEAVLGVHGLWRDPSRICGLIEQQAVLIKARRA